MKNAAKSLIVTFFEKYPVDAARLIETQPPEHVADFLTAFPPQHSAAVLQYTLPAIGAAILQAMPDQLATTILPAMATSSAVSILRHSPHAWQASVIGMLAPQTGTPLLRALTYPDHSAGQLADPHVPTMTEDRTVSDAIQWIRRTSRRTASEIYIIDRLHQLIGYVPVEALVTSDLEAPLGKIMEPPPDVLHASWSFAQLIARPQWELAPALPVVNETGTFLGVVRYPQLVKIQRDGRDADERLHDGGPSASNFDQETGHA